MHSTPRSVVLSVLLFLLLPGFAAAQSRDGRRASASLDGPSGLFKIWDAESLGPGEVNLSVGVNRYERDPGQLTFTAVPTSLAVGVFKNFEVFGSWVVSKHIEADGIQTNRIAAGQLPVGAVTPRGALVATTEAAFIDVRSATGRGELYGGVKYRFFSQRKAVPFSLAGVFVGSTPSTWSYDDMKRGLSNRVVTGGFGALVSTRAGRVGQFHGNFLVNLVRSPRFQQPTQYHLDIGHEFIYRAGAAFPNFGPAQFIIEVDAKVHAGDRTVGLNRQNPIDLLVGIRAFAGRVCALSAGYRATLDHIKEDPINLVLRGGTHGFVLQLSWNQRKG